MKSNNLHVVNEVTLPTQGEGRRPGWWAATWPALLCAAVIFAASSLPARNLPRAFVFPGQDKVQHAIAYGVMGYFICRARWLRASRPARFATGGLVSVLWALLFGIGDEFHQSFVPGRSVETMDAVADLVGAVLGVGVFFVTRRVPLLPSARAQRLPDDHPP